jgi:hypothetical protein
MKKNEIESANLRALEEFVSKEPRPDVRERIDFVLNYVGAKNSQLTSPNTREEVFGLLNKGLNKTQSQELIKQLVTIEWERASQSSDINTFMRGNSLFKTAMMSAFKSEMTSKKVQAFIENPLKSISNFKIPDYLIPIAAKIAAKNPAMVVFTMLLGPTVQHYNILATKEDKKGNKKKHAEYLHENSVAAKTAQTLTKNYLALASHEPKSPLEPSVKEQHKEALNTLIERITERNISIEATKKTSKVEPIEKEKKPTLLQRAITTLNNLINKAKDSIINLIEKLTGKPRTPESDLLTSPKTDTADQSHLMAPNDRGSVSMSTKEISLAFLDEHINNQNVSKNRDSVSMSAKEFSAEFLNELQQEFGKKSSTAQTSSSKDDRHNSQNINPDDKPVKTKNSTPPAQKSWTTGVLSSRQKNEVQSNNQDLGEKPKEQSARTPGRR